MALSRTGERRLNNRVFEGNSLDIFLPKVLDLLETIYERFIFALDSIIALGVVSGPCINMSVGAANCLVCPLLNVSEFWQ